jgi:hypothetical protein
MEDKIPLTPAEVKEGMSVNIWDFPLNVKKDHNTAWPGKIKKIVSNKVVTVCFDNRTDFIFTANLNRISKLEVADNMLAVSTEQSYKIDTILEMAYSLQAFYITGSTSKYPYGLSLTDFVQKKLNGEEIND